MLDRVVVNMAALAAALFKPLSAEPVLFLQSSEVLGRHWLPPFSGFSAGPGSVVFFSARALCWAYSRWHLTDKCMGRGFAWPIHVDVPSAFS